MSLGVRVFLSYARRDASPLAETVAALLQNKGFEVWRDRGGDPARAGVHVGD
jgi:hypothetical protein